MFKFKVVGLISIMCCPYLFSGFWSFEGVGLFEMMGGLFSMLILFTMVSVGFIFQMQFLSMGFSFGFISVDFSKLSGMISFYDVCLFFPVVVLCVGWSDHNVDLLYGVLEMCEGCSVVEVYLLFFQWDMEVLVFDDLFGVVSMMLEVSGLEEDYVFIMSACVVIYCMNYVVTMIYIYICIVNVLGCFMFTYGYSIYLYFYIKLGVVWGVFVQGLGLVIVFCYTSYLTLSLYYSYWSVFVLGFYVFYFLFKGSSVMCCSEILDKCGLGLEVISFSMNNSLVDWVFLCLQIYDGVLVTGIKGSSKSCSWMWCIGVDGCVKLDLFVYLMSKVVKGLSSWLESKILFISESFVYMLGSYSLDVMHSLGLMEFGNKLDSTPGVLTVLAVKGICFDGLEFDMKCTELCGGYHSYMFSKVLFVDKFCLSGLWYSFKEIEGLVLMILNNNGIEKSDEV